MPTELFLFFAQEAGELPKLITEFNAIGSATGNSAKIAAGQVLIDHTCAIAEKYPWHDTAPPLKATEGAGKINWGNLLPAIQAVLALLQQLGILTPKA